MTHVKELIQGEHRRLYDDRFRIALPTEYLDALGGEQADVVLAKEREGCLSLWNCEVWQRKVGRGVELLQKALELEFLANDFDKVQRFARLLSTGSRAVKLGQRGRLLIPEGFREFLAVEPNSEVMVIGAGVCVEMWNPEVWKGYLREDLGQFHAIFRELVTRERLGN